MRSIKISLIWTGLLVLSLAACTLSAKPPTTGPAPAGETALPGATASDPGQTPAAPEPSPTTVPTATATPEPMAITVDGGGASMVEYQAELNQLKEANAALKKTTTPEEDRQKVLDNLRDSLLLAQQAVTDGFVMDDAALQARVGDLAAEMGGEQALADWMKKYGYTESAFKASLFRSSAAAWQVEKIIAAVPEQAEQVHARQILVYDQSSADVILRRVQTPNADFDDYAFGYDQTTGGDLGWFPRGYLLQPEVEEAAFALQPGEISAVIKSDVGYHIVKVLARETRPLSTEARRALQQKALASWLAAQAGQSQIQILVP